ncbi:MAG: helix-turn-helix transcriptional regulator [Clostridia bacterium]|nr:helix-turn-helix transcriptional regulator [Clostridia bacterium]
MAIVYKIDVLSELKRKGYSSYVLMNKDKMGENYIGQRQIQQIRNGEIVSNAVLNKLCKLLNCQPGDILEFVEEE